MIDIFARAEISHVAGAPCRGRAAFDVLTPADFDRAFDEITQWEGYAPTPLLALDELAAAAAIDKIFYKHEGGRFGLGSFKALGGAYAALRVLRRTLEKDLGREVAAAEIRLGERRAQCAKITLTAATDGNHGRALAWGCRRFGAQCVIVIHSGVSEGRADAMRRLGARVVRIDGDYDDSVARARGDAAANGWHVVADTSWPGHTQPPRDVMAGYGVMTREICDALARPPTHVFLQGGVGGLAAAVAAGLRQRWGDDAPRVIVVEPALAACLFASAKAKKIVAVEIEKETIMAGLSCGEPSPLAWEILAEEASDFLTIPDSLIRPAMRLLARPDGADPTAQAGESAVAGLAALLAVCQSAAMRRKLGLDSSARALLIGSEGATDPDIFAALTAEGDD